MARVKEVPVAIKQEVVAEVKVNAQELQNKIDSGRALKDRKLIIRSKNETANVLRKVIPTGGKRVIFRLGSTTSTEDVRREIGIPQGAVIHEINTVEACKVSGDKKLMKEAFNKAGVTTSEWHWMGDPNNWVWENNMFPSIIKHRHSSKGNGIFYITNEEELSAFEKAHADNIGNYIIEKYYTYSKEYRLHVDKFGCFYTCRKMLKRDAEDRWHRHDNNSVWFMEENPLFKKPDCWDALVADCVLAMESVGLDVTACDIIVEGNKVNNPSFLILETNSAPSLGEITSIKYIDELKRLVDGI